MKSSARTQAERTAATRAALVAAGRRLFAEHGFAGVGTETLVREAGVSRGALYHQFGDKTELFAAVLADVEGEVTRSLATAVLAEGEADFVTTMRRAVDAWLDACGSADVQRIVLIDGPAVLGWVRWRAICQPHILGLIESVLAAGVANGTLLPLPVKPLGHILLAIADEAALYLNAATDHATARDELTRVIEPLVRALVKP
ncbi:TetR/AcrR family transcriptional regulator [Nonomuraea sp. SBT364]|uniref:TetR/AcrR family transcriptional regulator n=1 Tax=Nonomuraea sp. SBT364 TaxID=1580530 RepID=UPI00066B65CB|nr:TetR/AcrR family transcriptional regulator [Nonomuraea sp. SBT364]